jgi:drug/metabolite transporter (DMT)-like permease
MKPSEWAMLVVLSVFWGGSFFFVEVALRGFQPFAIVFLRVVLAAIIIMLQPELKNGFSWRGLGQVAVLGAAVSYGLAGIFGKRFKKAAPAVNAAGMLICSSMIMLPLVLMTGALGLSQPSTAAITAICGLATVSTALAYLLYFRILASAGATNVLLVTFLIPVSALLLGVGVLV